MTINEDPNQPLENNCPWPDFEELYNDMIDSSFFTLGRNITLHLTPIRIAASGIAQSTIKPFQYNPYLGRAARPAPPTVSTTQTPAVQHTPRDVVYKAHIKHGPREDTLQDVGIELKENEVMTTTVAEAGAHIGEAESATIDGNRYILKAGPRPIGLGAVRYLITVWEQSNEKEA